MRLRGRTKWLCAAALWKERLGVVYQQQNWAGQQYMSAIRLADEAEEEEEEEEGEARGGRAGYGEREEEINILSLSKDWYGGSWSGPEEAFRSLYKWKLADRSDGPHLASALQNLPTFNSYHPLSLHPPAPRAHSMELVERCLRWR